MKVLAFAASNSGNSINKRLVTHASEVLIRDILPEATVEMLDIHDYEMPIYSPEREAEGGVPDLARKFYAKIGDSDALLISYAEHNGHYTAAWKNIFDWLSRINKEVFQGKPMVILSASPGKGGGASVMAAAKTSAGFFGADLKGSLSVGRFGETFDKEQGQLIAPDLVSGLSEALGGLKTG
ncbi:NADPH-dependent FMN reductase [Litoreibacter arenae]|uniref:NADPH-dependent FMN reductase-like domain-containing protein n=1 Tax=Litoreibacter arenae DSM 19593 TaxID=1123360 RepID=S9QJN3_9RHOB|nr:NAD(P)H-dependent oxidoreductase [Litoreibacter arenae]EPX81636.1 hypothetical protein thalar_00192 [Litoreibacter arenae DSM 19593]